MLSGIGAILNKELKHLRRDRMTFGMIVMIPLVQLLLFGYAINTDVRHIAAGLVDHSGSVYARRLTQAVTSTQVVDFRHRYSSIQAAEQGITRGEVQAVLVIPADFVARLDSAGVLSSAPHRPGAEPVAQWLVDGSDTLVTAAVKGLRAMPLQELIDRPVPRGNNTFAMAPYFNPEQRSVVNIAPGLLAIILTMTMTLFTSTSLVRERELGNMEFLITTPIRPIELMVGKILPYIFVGLIQAGIILMLSHWIFSVPINGGPVAILLASLLFILASLVLGLLISTRAQTQMQAMQLTIFIMLPSILLSGFMFPYAGMPEAAQWIAEVLPATHFVRTIRGIVLRDASLADLWFDLLWLAGFATVGLLVAALGFRKRLD